MFLLKTGVAMKVLFVIALGFCTLQGCSFEEALIEAEFNGVLEDSWSTSSKKSALEDHVADELGPVLREILEKALKSRGASLSDSIVAFEAGSRAPQLDVRNLSVTASATQYCTEGEWRISPTWASTGAKITVTAKAKLYGVSVTLNATLKNLSLGGSGTWRIVSPRGKGFDSATARIDAVVLSGDLSWEAGGFSGSWKERSTELAEVLVESALFRPIFEEFDW